MGLRGRPVTELTDQTTLLMAPTPKPPEFYDLVERLCPASAYLDVFSRYKHNNKWTCWGDEAPATTEGRSSGCLSASDSS